MKQPYHLHFVGDEINLITLAFVIVAVLLLIWLGQRLLRQLAAERDLLRAQLPAAIVGEMFTRDEFVQIYERLNNAEAKLEYLERKQDAILADVQRVEGHG